MIPTCEGVNSLLANWLYLSVLASACHQSHSPCLPYSSICCHSSASACKKLALWCGAYPINPIWRCDLNTGDPQMSVVTFPSTRMAVVLWEVRSCCSKWNSQSLILSPLSHRITLSKAHIILQVIIKKKKKKKTLISALQTPNVSRYCVHVVISACGQCSAFKPPSEIQ